MAGGFVWNAAKTLAGAPGVVTAGSIGTWTALDLTADADDFSHVGFQVSFTAASAEIGTVDVRIAASINGTLRQGGQNEPATLTLLSPIGVNGNAAAYVSPMMFLNDAGAGVWHPNIELSIVNNLPTSSITVTNGIYRTASFPPT